MVLAYETRGVGRPLLLLPWFGLDRSSMVAAFEPAFTGRDGWRRIYADLPGTGGEPTSDAVCAAVVNLLDAEFGPEPVALAGCSSARG
ncbi:hypothetical protein E1212_28515 [Jiangella ureilytica]|uniref:Alpha/beta hydrolase n=2 Tax=Jiangella ureilytica TaxID=2530374 RepID=A0A4R4R9B9_9ACTN|nr:hypothetical protein E1212_28515 [Jiangella ureilytica]